MRSHLEMMHFTTVTDDHDTPLKVAPGADISAISAAADSSRKSPRNNSSNSSNIISSNTNAFVSKSKNDICSNTTKRISYPARTKADRSKSKDAACVRERIAKFQKSHNPSASVKNRNRKQILYLHPGPPKTATTTIQQMLTNHWEELLEDNIAYLGKTMPREKYHCNLPLASYCTMNLFFQQRAKNETTLCVDSIMDQLDEYYSMGMDVILSDEVIGAMFSPTAATATKDQREALGIWNFFCQMVRRNDWEVRLLIGYRPYFDFVRSAYFQTYRARGKPRLHKWPTNGGKHIPTLDQGLFETTWTFSDQLVKTFRPFADRIDVFDITTNSTARGDVLVRFLCNHLEDAKLACSKAMGEIRSNPAKSLEYDRIATAAAQKGLFETFKFQRAEVAHQVENFWMATTNNNNTTKELPLVCPSKNRSEQLKTLSLEREMSVFPERKPHWETPELFDAMMAKNKLCSVDVDKVLEDEEWKAFFRSLNQSRKSGTKNSP